VLLSRPCKSNRIAKGSIGAPGEGSSREGSVATPAPKKVPQQARFKIPDSVRLAGKTRGGGQPSR